ncbi:MAG: HEAT repeat domain-containing protein [Pirellulaceae bacterium]
MHRTFRLAFVLLLTCGPAICLAQEEEAAEALELATAALVDAIHDDNPEVRNAAWFALSRIKTSSDSVIDAIGESLLDEDSETREAAMRVVKRQAWDDQTKGQLLFQMLSSDNQQIAQDAARNFAGAWQAEFVDKLLQQFQSSETSTERKGLLLTVMAKNSQQLPAILPVLEEIFRSSPVEFQLQILTTIGEYGEAAQEGLPFLAGQCDHQDERVRLAAVDSITRIMTAGESVTTASSDREQRYIDAFMDRYDTDGNGVIDAVEGRAARSIERFDSDGDGRVTRAEMRSIFGRSQPARSTRESSTRER